jgi:hypothetical protein
MSSTVGSSGFSSFFAIFLLLGIKKGFSDFSHTIGIELTHMFQKGTCAIFAQVAPVPT